MHFQLPHATLFSGQPRQSFGACTHDESQLNGSTCTFSHRMPIYLPSTNDNYNHFDRLLGFGSSSEPCLTRANALSATALPITSLQEQGQSFGDIAHDEGLLNESTRTFSHRVPFFLRQPLGFVSLSETFLAGTNALLATALPLFSQHLGVRHYQRRS